MGKPDQMFGAGGCAHRTLDNIERFHNPRQRWQPEIFRRKGVLLTRPFPKTRSMPVTMITVLDHPRTRWAGANPR